MDLTTRARDVAHYFDISEQEATDRLAAGFHFNHALVAEDFRSANADVSDPDSLLSWYRNTTAYIWELSAYHLEPGFNYMGMCDGIATHLLAVGHEHVLSLGDGVGDLSLHLKRRGLMPVYHDLAGSRTAGFARHLRIRDTAGAITEALSESWHPPTMTCDAMDAVVALDYFEHLVNVEQWAQFVYDVLRPGGIFLAQNAFAIGDAENGDSIPMHLSVNNRYVTEWAPMMEGIGFTLQPSGWWEKP